MKTLKCVEYPVLAMCIVEIIGSLSNLTDDGNGNENVKKATGLRTMPPTENSIFAQFMTM